MSDDPVPDIESESTVPAGNTPIEGWAERANLFLGGALRLFAEANPLPNGYVVDSKINISILGPDNDAAC